MLLLRCSRDGSFRNRTVTDAFWLLLRIPTEVPKSPPKAPTSSIRTHIHRDLLLSHIARIMVSRNRHCFCFHFYLFLLSLQYLQRPIRAWKWTSSANLTEASTASNSKLISLPRHLQYCFQWGTCEGWLGLCFHNSTSRTIFTRVRWVTKPAVLHFRQSRQDHLWPPRTWSASFL